MSDEIKPHLETTLDDYKAYAYYIREDAQSRGVENTRLSIYGIYMAVVEKQVAELERYETARQEDDRRLEQVKGERDAMLEALKDAIALIYDHHERGHIHRAYEQRSGDCEACEKGNRLRNLYALKAGKG